VYKGQLIEALRRPGVLERVCIGSFSDERLERVDQAFGDAVCLSFSPQEIARLQMLSIAGLPARKRRPARARSAGRTPPNRPFRGRIASIPLRRGPIPLATRRLVDYAHRAGLAVHVWTIDDPAEMGRLLDIDVDGIMTDEPRVLLDVMAKRGAWPADDGAGA